VLRESYRREYDAPVWNDEAEGSLDGDRVAPEETER
jgi:hypothetical protein